MLLLRVSVLFDYVKLGFNALLSFESTSFFYVHIK